MSNVEGKTSQLHNTVGENQPIKLSPVRNETAKDMSAVASVCKYSPKAAAGSASARECYRGEGSRIAIRPISALGYSGEHTPCTIGEVYPNRRGGGEYSRLLVLAVRDG